MEVATQIKTIHKSNRNNGINKKPGRKKKKKPQLTPKQAKFVEVFNRTGNESLAKREAGYSPNTDLVKIRNSGVICGAVRDIKQELVNNAHIYLDKLEEIMNDDFTSSKVRADIAMNLLDRAGYKAVTKNEVSGNVTGGISQTITLDLVQRTRQMIAEKVKTIDIIADIEK